MSDKDEQPPPPLGVKDGIAALALLALFVVMLVATWQRWTHPVIDHPREMNIPARILAGDRLFVDIFYYYGPVAPFLNAALYAAFGIHLSVLHFAGAACGLLTIALTYWIARQLLTVVQAALTTALVLVLCVLPPYFGNYLQPYAYAALYGFTCALASLAFLVRAVVSTHSIRVWPAGVCIGLTMICKPELGLLGLSAAGGVWLILSLESRRPLWRLLLPLVALPAVIAGLTYGAIALLTPWRSNLEETYRSFSQPQMMYFVGWLNGQRDWPYTGWALAASAGLALVVCGGTAICGGLVAGDGLVRRPSTFLRAVAVTAAGWVMWTWPPRGPDYIDISPFRTAPILLVAILAYSCRALWRWYAAGHAPSRSTRALLVIALFAFVAIGRVMFNVSLRTPYTIFTVPVLVILWAFVTLCVSPRLLLQSRSSRSVATNTAAALMAIGTAVTAFQYGLMARAYSTAAITAPRGTLITMPALARPFTEAIQFARTHTAAGEPVVALPVGSLINFLAERPNPLADEIIVPGYLTPGREQAFIRTIDERQVKVLFLVNWLTPEYRDTAFGSDWNPELGRWIDAHYRSVETFTASGRDGSALPFGDMEFFIRAYERRTN